MQNENKVDNSEIKPYLVLKCSIRAVDHALRWTAGQYIYQLTTNKLKEYSASHQSNILFPSSIIFSAVAIKILSIYTIAGITDFIGSKGKKLYNINCGTIISGVISSAGTILVASQVRNFSGISSPISILGGYIAGYILWDFHFSKEYKRLGGSDLPVSNSEAARANSYTNLCKYTLKLPWNILLGGTNNITLGTDRFADGLGMYKFIELCRNNLWNKSFIFSSKGLILTACVSSIFLGINSLLTTPNKLTCLAAASISIANEASEYSSIILFRPFRQKINFFIDKKIYGPTKEYILNILAEQFGYGREIQERETPTNPSTPLRRAPSSRSLFSPM